MTGDDREFVIDREGSFTWNGVKVIERDNTGRPRKIVSVHRDKLEKKFKQIARSGDEPIYSVDQLTNSDHFLSGAMDLCPEMELSALKSVLLTFDHLLTNDELRFTRSPDLTGVRDFVKKAIETREIDVHGFYRYSLGIQYERLQDIQKIRRKSAYRSWNSSILSWPRATMRRRHLMPCGWWPELTRSDFV